MNFLMKLTLSTPGELTESVSVAMLKELTFSSVSIIMALHLNPDTPLAFLSKDIATQLSFVRYVSVSCLAVSTGQ